MKKIISFILIFALLLTSCSLPEDVQEESAHEENEELDSTAVPGGGVRLALINSDSLFPLFVNNSSIYYLNNLIYDNLFEYGEDASIDSNIVEHYEFSKDRKTISLTLRDNIYFHDGEKLTADDVIYTFDLIKNMKRGPYYRQMVSASGSVLGFDPENFIVMTKFNDRNIDIKLDKTYNKALYMLVFPVLPSHRKIEDFDYDNDEPDYIKEETADYFPIGSGPFKVDEIEDKKYINLSLFEDYHGRLPYIENIQAIYYDDYELAKLGFETGDIDILNFTSSDWNKFVDNDLVNVESYHSNSLDMIFLNQNSPIFSGDSGKKIKQAISRSINKKRIIDRVYMGNALEISLPINYDLFEELDLKSDIYYNLDVAKDLLAQAGYSKLNDKGLVENDQGKTINIEIKTNKLDSDKQIVLNFIIEDLKSVGINAYTSSSYENIGQASNEEKNKYSEDFTNQIKSGNFDMALMTVNLSATPDIGAFLHSNSIDNSFNLSRYANPQMDSYIWSINYSSNKEDLRETYSNILDLLSEDVPILPLCIKDFVLVYDSSIQGEINPSNTDIYNSLRNIYLPKDE